MDKRNNRNWNALWLMLILWKLPWLMKNIIVYHRHTNILTKLTLIKYLINDDNC